MSERYIYFRDQADKCRQHADIVGDARTREELRKLAAVYIARAEQIESKGRLGVSVVQSLAQPKGARKRRFISENSSRYKQ